MALEDLDADGVCDSFQRVGRDYVLVRPHVKAAISGGKTITESELKALGGKCPPGTIVIPDAMKKKATRGTVVKTGKGRRTDYGVFIEVETKVGDDVIFAMHARTHALTVGGEEMLMVKDEDILAVIEPGTNVDIKVGTTDV